MRVAHLTASPFFGGPERQMLGLALNLPREIQSLFFSFPENGLCQPFLEELQRFGFVAKPLNHNTPHCLKALRDLKNVLQSHRTDLLCCHGYKANLLGLLAARAIGIPIISVSRGWTWATLKVRCYEWLDRWTSTFMDRVVCVSKEQARRVLRYAVPAQRVQVIRNAIRTERFPEADNQGRAFLQSFFRKSCKFFVGSAGRFSPEKGFRHLIDAAAKVISKQPDAGFLLFGNGPLQEALKQQINALHLREHFVLADFRSDLDRWMPNFDVFTLPSHTEGLPNVVLEALAARVPVVATAVGGTPEVIQDGRNGFLVPDRCAQPLSDRIHQLLEDDGLRESMGRYGFVHVRDHFTFEAQAFQYAQLFQEVLGAKAKTIKLLNEADRPSPLSAPVHYKAAS